MAGRLAEEDPAGRASGRETPAESGLTISPKRVFFPRSPVARGTEAGTPVAPVGWFVWSPGARRWLVGLLTVAVLGCSSGITVQTAGGPDLLTAWRASIAQADGLS